jgi:AAA+ ATPase superfamily predicted ATPase
MRYFYPREQQALFTDRERELAELEYRRDQLHQGRQEHTSLFGLRRIGKTLLLKELVRRTLIRAEEVKGEGGEIIPVYMDFSHICSSPETFATGYVGWVSYWYLTRGQASPISYLDIASLTGEVMLAGNREVAGTVRRLAEALRTARPDRPGILRLAFEFPDELAQLAGCKFMLIFDEFQEIKTLANFQDSQNVIALFRATMQTQSQILYILAGSAITAMTELIADHRSPLFVHFSQMPITPFTPTDTTALSAKLLGDEPAEDVTLAIHRLTGGHPFYATALSERLRRLVEMGEWDLDTDAVQRAFIIEALSSAGRIYSFCRYVYDLSLQKARGYGSLKATLQVLSIEEGLTSSQMARELRVTPGSARDYLKWLQDVDLVLERERAYFFQDPVMRYWVAHATRGVEVSLTATAEDLADLVAGLGRYFH